MQAKKKPVEKKATVKKPVKKVAVKKPVAAKEPPKKSAKSGPIKTAVKKFVAGLSSMTKPKKKSGSASPLAKSVAKAAAKKAATPVKKISKPTVKAAPKVKAAKPVAPEKKSILKKLTTTIKKTAKPAKPSVAKKSQEKPEPKKVAIKPIPKKNVVKPIVPAKSTTSANPAVSSKPTASTRSQGSGILKAPSASARIRPTRKRLSIRDRFPVVKPRHFFRVDMPQNYGETYLRAMARDPEWIFAYWEITLQNIDDFKKRIGLETFLSARRILRVIDVTESDGNESVGSDVFTIETGDGVNNWYIRVPPLGRTYCIEFGLITGRGDFYLLARSNAISVPRASVSHEESTTWTDQELYKIVGLRRIGASENLPITESVEKTPAKVFQSVPVMVGSSENVSSSPSSPSFFFGASDRR
jgi:hypothetical protein